MHNKIFCDSVGLCWERLGAVKNAKGCRKKITKVLIFGGRKKGLMVTKLTRFHSVLKELPLPFYG